MIAVALATRADQADQPRGRQQLRDLHQLALAPDEAGERDWRGYTIGELPHTSILDSRRSAMDEAGCTLHAPTVATFTPLSDMLREKSI